MSTPSSDSLQGHWRKATNIKKVAKQQSAKAFLSSVGNVSLNAFYRKAKQVVRQIMEGNAPSLGSFEVMKMGRKIIITVALLAPLWRISAAEVSASTSADDLRQAGESIRKFERGTSQLVELSEAEGSRGRQRLISYYVSNANTNTISLKAKLLISRCFALEKDFREAALLAEQYVQVYSNDWRGWRILGSSSCALSNWNKGVMAFTNAVILGDEACYQLLAIAALQADRLDLVRDIVPHLLILKEAKRTDENDKLEIVMGLALYAFKADQKDVFVKALERVPAEKILSRKDVTMVVEWGCEKFTNAEVRSICKQLDEARKRKTTSPKK